MTAGNIAISPHAATSFARSLEPVAFAGSPVADGVYLQARMEPQADCMLVIIGATPEGRKELVGFQVGVRESAQSWRELLVGLKARGLAVPPELAVGDGALGFWKALDEVFPGTRHQRCWFHKVANVLNHFPKSMQPAVTADLREISNAETRAAALAAIEIFKEKYAAKYARGVACLTKDTEALLAFYDFPGEHWEHLRTSNPIESVFATPRFTLQVRHRLCPESPWERPTATSRLRRDAACAA
jgi:transposase-like protein